MSTLVDRGWMYDVEETGRFLSYTFCSNLDVFLEFAFSNKAFVDNNRIKCPCLECDNKHFKTRNDVMFHLYEKGFTPNYTTWSAHGETSSRIQQKGKYTGPVEDDERTCKVVDEVVPSNADNTTYESNYDSSILEGTKGCQKNLKVKVTSELFKSKSKGTRGCRKNLEVNLTSELFKLKWKNNIIKPALPQNETKKIMKKHGVLNVPQVSTTDSRLSIFKYPSQSLRKNLHECKYMGDAMTNAHTYILLNCEEVRPFVRLFNDLTRQRRPNIDANGLDIYRDQHFAAWFQNYVFQESNDISQDLKDLAQGPIDTCYIKDIVSMVTSFTPKDIVKGGSVTKVDVSGLIHLVGSGCKDDLVHIDSKVKLLNGNPFVLASQTEQVYYGPYPRISKELRDWWDVIKTQDEVKMKLLTECI
ncbi:transposon, En/Spm-like, transposase-associated domain protein [Tanacetum coccineum]